MQWYEELFNNYANSYDDEVFTKGTSAEADFIENEIYQDKSIKILDIGCGTGRHSIELAKRGYNVTGIDLSESMLNKAREKAKKENVNIHFIKMDARTLNFFDEYNLVIMVCEGAFPLMETDEMNFLILKNAFNALKQGGKMIFTTLNGLFPLFHSVKDFISNNETKDGIKDISFDLMTFREKMKYEFYDDKGTKKEIMCNERFYVPSEIAWLLKSLNFSNIDILGCKIGEWSRINKLTTEDFEMLVIAEK